MLANLALQTIAHAIEVVLVTDSPEKLRPIPSDPHPFFSLTILETRTIRQTGAAKALGVEAARAPLVMFLEDHSFPDPGCAQAMLERHRQQEHGSPRVEDIVAYTDHVVTFSLGGIRALIDKKNS